MASSKYRPRLILLTQWFDPEPTFKGLLFARALTERGFDVEVVTGFPNYPGGKVYPGHKIQMIRREKIDGVSITRLPLYPSHDQGVLARVANYVSFFMSALVYLTFFARPADVVYAYHPPLTVGLAAVCAKVFRKTPTVVDIQDLWPDTLRATGMVGNASVLKLVGHGCQWLYRSVNHIVVLSPGFRKLLLDRGVSEEKITVIYNWADEAALMPANAVIPAAITAPDKFRVLFAGNMGKAQALDNVLEAAKRVGRMRDDVEFVFLGGGIEVAHLKARAMRENITNTRFLPQVPMTEVGHYLAAADCALVHLRADPLFSVTIPSKTQAYMAAAKPVLMVVEGDAAELVRDSGCGIVVAPDNPDDLADAVCAMASQSPQDLLKMGRLAADYYRKNLSLTVGADHFSSILYKVISRKI
jgi:colanic acid biosynthesis glycosyl transferase WcaI